MHSCIVQLHMRLAIQNTPDLRQYVDLLRQNACYSLISFIIP